MSHAHHWETVYRNKAVDQVSWFQPHAETSLRLIETLLADAGPSQGGECAPSGGSEQRERGGRFLNRAARIIDVGAGASVLVDDLLDAGYQHLTVLDIAASALAVSRARLGERAAQVDWRVGDVTTVALPEAGFDIWHDRAVFHFLTDAADRRRYVDQVLRAVRPGGHVIVATFGLEGPLQCSNLDVCRYAPDGLHGEFGGAFELLGHHAEMHHTPAGRDQAFVYCYCRRG